MRGFSGTPQRFADRGSSPRVRQRRKFVTPDKLFSKPVGKSSTAACRRAKYTTRSPSGGAASGDRPGSLRLSRRRSRTTIDIGCMRPQVSEPP